MKLFYRMLGEGSPLVILHGLFGISDNWISFARSMAAKYKVYIPDLRNHGQSPHSSVFNFPSLEGDLAEFLDENHLDDVLLLGHSLGGKTAMLYTLHNPFRVKRLIVVDISMRRYFFRGEHQVLIDAMKSVDLSKAESRTDIERQLREKIPSERLRQFILKSVYWRDKEHLDWRLNLKSLDENLPFLFEGVETEGTYPGPALFVRGELSDYVTDEDIPDIKRKFPEAVIRTIKGASHWVHADAPGEFLEAVEEFLKKNPLDR